MTARYQRIVDLAQLIGLLQSTRYGITLDQIAERYEVSRRTAERLLGAVRDCYPDLEAEVRDGRKFWRLPRPKGRGASFEPPDAIKPSLDDWVNKIVFRAINSGNSSLGFAAADLLDSQSPPMPIGALTWDGGTLTAQ